MKMNESKVLFSDQEDQTQFSNRKMVDGFYRMDQCRCVVHLHKSGETQVSEHRHEQESIGCPGCWRMEAIISPENVS